MSNGIVLSNLVKSNILVIEFANIPVIYSIAIFFFDFFS
jgi:hypothetical protein